jgi:methylphosphotriester-DNA--protein-cysteine methyltransferase
LEHAHRVLPDNCVDILWQDGGQPGFAVGMMSSATQRVALVQQALRGLASSGSAVRVEELAARLDVSRQHLAAQFREHVGLSPKLFARICRFRLATAAIRATPAPDWAQLALECGYFDQSHLIHDFQELAGNTPERFHFSNHNVV